MEKKFEPLKDKKGLKQITFTGKRDPHEALEGLYSKSEITRLIKQNGIKIATDVVGETWIKVGKHYLILTDSIVAHNAMMHWEYHYDFKPKTLNWEPFK